MEQYFWQANHTTKQEGKSIPSHIFNNLQEVYQHVKANYPKAVGFTVHPELFTDQTLRTEDSEFVSVIFTFNVRFPQNDSWPLYLFNKEQANLGPNTTHRETERQDFYPTEAEVKNITKEEFDKLAANFDKVEYGEFFQLCALGVYIQKNYPNAVGYIFQKEFLNSPETYVNNTDVVAQIVLSFKGKKEEGDDYDNNMFWKFTN